jgi:metallophosphoesterase superfamily enzyme
VGLASRGKKLLILGDVKHKIPSVSYREDREIPPFLRRLQEIYSEVLIVAGNHDGGLAAILPEGIASTPGHGTGLDDVGVCHGHVWPSKEAMAGRKLVMGHVHPSVLLTDSIGGKTNEKCWVRTGFRKERVLERYSSCPEELVIVPAFNPLLTGTPINARPGTRLGPVFRNGLVDEKDLRIYLLDGSNLGALARM